MSAFLTIYRSSAGSGKTFTLVARYLLLLLPEPRRYRHILAVTFTNKATAEMKERILMRLFDLSQARGAAAQGVAEYASIREELARLRPGEDPDTWAPQAARTALMYILGDYSHFSVSTIESFFQKILRAFARELDIPLGYEVELQQDFVKDRLIERLALEVGDNEQLFALLNAYQGYRLQEDKGWQVFGPLRALAGELFQESFIVHAKAMFDAWAAEGDGTPSQLLQIANDLNEKAWRRRRSFEQALIERAQEGLKLIESAGLSANDFKFKDKSCAKYLENIVAGRFEPGSRALQAAEGHDIWIGKKDPNYQRVMDLLDGGLFDHFRALVQFYEAERPAYELDKMVTQTATAFGLLGYLEQLLNDYRLEHRTLMVSDTGRLLTRAIQESTPPFVYEKVGVVLQHYLLDEFQDTSNLQWENFRPLIEEALSSGHSNLIVGDVKQAIYRWRNGNPQLMLGLEDEPAVNPWIDLANLSANYRTAPDIVTFNNALFERAPQRLLSALEDDGYTTVADATLLPQAYQMAAQEPKQHDLVGYLQVQVLEPEEHTTKAFQEAAIKETIAGINQLIAEGYQGGDIALLVRNRREGVALAEALLQDNKSINSAETLLVNTHPAVRWLVAALQLLLQPDSELYQAKWLDLDRQLRPSESEREGPTERSVARAKPSDVARLLSERERLRARPVYQCVEALLALLPGPPSLNGYLLGFLDAVWEYSIRVDTSIDGFLAWWEREREKRSVYGSQSRDAIRILTIHKAKGLEFPVVILPFVTWDLGPKTNSDNYLWVSTQGTAYEEVGTLPLPLRKDLMHTAFARAYAQEVISSYLDNLNLLYVAMTRPEQRLYLYVPTFDPGKKGKSEEQVPLKTVGDLVRKLVHQGDTLPGRPVKNGWEQGQPIPPEEQEKVKKQLQREEQNAEARTVQAPITGTLTELLLHPKDADELSVRFQTQDIERLRDHAASPITQGKLLHRALEQVYAPEDIPRVLQRLELSGEIGAEELPEYQRQLTTIVRHEPARSWFDGSWEVRTEAAILIPGLGARRPDRVLIRGQEAVVVDFKTGEPRISHQRQVQEYMQLLQELGYPRVRGYLYYTTRLDVVAVERA